MQNQELSRQLQILNNLFQRTQAASSGDIEMQAHWAKYLCILSAGFIENAIKEIYVDFAHRAASEPVANYTSSTLSRIQNPKTQRFVETANAFKRTWGDELRDFVEDNGRKEAIDSIMANRHLIAHGKNSGITLVRIRDYLDKAIEVIDFIETQCVQ